MGGGCALSDYGTTRFEVHRFFLKGCPETQMEMQDELTDVTWRAITDIDQGWRAGYFAYLPPILRVMRALTRFGGPHAFLQAIKIAKESAPSIEYRGNLSRVRRAGIPNTHSSTGHTYEHVLLGSENYFGGPCDALSRGAVTL